MRPQHPFDHPQQPFIGQVGRKGLFIVDQPGEVADLLRRVGVAVLGRGRQNPITYCRHGIRWNHLWDHTPTVELHPCE